MSCFHRVHPILCILTLITVISVNADIKKDCRKQSQVSWASLKQLRTGNFDEDDQNLKCYLRCFMARNGILNNKNEIDVERALRNLPQSVQETSKKLLLRCKDVESDDSCNKAFQIAKCFVKMQPEILRDVPFV
nr:putative odorant-binding protein 4 [Sclerodermus sichuanensis]